MRKRFDGRGRADLHIHTGVGDGMASVPQLLEYIETRTELDVVAFTDHDDLQGALQAREMLCKGRYRFEVVVGEEISSLGGHLLALFIEEPVRPYQTLERTLEAIHRQNGLCVVPHPLSWLTTSVGERGFKKILVDCASTPGFDGIEVANGSIAGRVVEERARRLNRKTYKLAQTGGSDAHFLPLIGSAYTLFDGRTAADLRRALESRSTRGRRDRSKTMSGVPWSDIVGQQFRSLVVLPLQRAGIPVQSRLSEKQ